MKWWPEQCVAGDMVRVTLGSVKHYGVFISEDEIIQFGPPPVSFDPTGKNDFSVCVANADDFSCGRIIERAILDKAELKKRIPPEKTIELARSRIGEKGYSLIHNNCEHFAYECVFGVKHSSQEHNLREKWKNRPILDIYFAPVSEDDHCECKDVNDIDFSNRQAFEYKLIKYAAERSIGIEDKNTEPVSCGRGAFKLGQFFISISVVKGALLVVVSNKMVSADLINITDKYEKQATAKKHRGLLKGFFSVEKAVDITDNPDDYLKQRCLKKYYDGNKRGLLKKPDDCFVKVYGIDGYDGFRFAVCSEKMQTFRLYIYKNGSATVQKV